MASGGKEVGKLLDGKC